jgi:hypothetical protein
MNSEIEFIKKKLMKKGYPLENYVQSLLVDDDWHVQPNAYFLDKDTNQGRELDIKAVSDYGSDSWTHFTTTLLIQCRRLPGNAWIFFSIPKPSALYMPSTNFNIAGFLKTGHQEIFDMKKTHLDKREVLATNYCEIITNKERSNKRVDNIWECVITLIKAASQETEEQLADTEQYLNEDIGSFDEFVADPFEVAYFSYPVIVFDGKMYEAKFSDDEITLERKKYVQLFVDYISGRYKGRFSIDVISKEKFSRYLKDVNGDITIFNKRRVEKSQEYEGALFKALREYLKENDDST